jgi:hypothetical protein
MLKNLINESFALNFLKKIIIIKKNILPWLNFFKGFSHTNLCLNFSY